MALSAYITLELSTLDGTEINFQSQIDVDSALSDVSENPVQNKVIKSALGDKLESVSVDGVTITGDGTPSDPLVSVGGGGASAINDLTDVTLTTRTPGRVLGFDGSGDVIDVDGASGGSTGLNDLTDVDLSGQADGDFLQRASSVWVPRSKTSTSLQLYMHDTFDAVPLTSMTRVLVGTGSTSRWVHRSTQMTTGTTAGSSVRLVTQNFPGLNIGVYTNNINYQKVVAVRFTASADNKNTANGTKHLQLGGAFNTTGDLDKMGVGFRIDNAAIKGVCYKTSLTEVNLGQNLTGYNIRNLLAISYGDGRIEWYVDGTLRGTSNDAPNSSSELNTANIKLVVMNNTDILNCGMEVHEAKIYIQQ